MRRVVRTVLQVGVKESSRLMAPPLPPPPRSGGEQARGRIINGYLTGRPLSNASVAPRARRSLRTNPRAIPLSD